MINNAPHEFTSTWVLCCSLLLVLGGCANQSNSDYLPRANDEVRQVNAWQADNNQASQNLTLDALINDSTLSALIQEAFSANPGLQQTLLTLKIHQAEQRQTRAAQLPDVEGGFNASREEGAERQYSGSATINWEVDLWRKLADSNTAALVDVAQQQALYQAARDALAAQVMKDWLGLISGQNMIDIEQRRLATLEKNEQFILQRYRNGLGSLEDLDSARSSAASTRATLAAYRESQAALRRSLQTTLGHSRSELLTVPNHYPSVIKPLAELPEQSLQRRPDLQAAYLALESTQLRTKVAYKALLPSINLKAALQDVADSPGAALLSDPVWSLLAQLTAPLYRGGELHAAVDVAELNSAYAYQDYRQTLLTAINEVGDTLGLEQSLTRQQQHVSEALASARNNLTQYQNSYRAGLVTILDLLNVQQQTYDLESRLDDLNYNRLANRIDLGLALGLDATP
ncbi:TolC family protein [Porticoccus sp.]